MTSPDPARLLRALLRAEADFVVIGAGAAWLQGNPVATMDVDIMPRQDVENAERIADALNTLEPSMHGRSRLVEERDFLGWQPFSVMTNAGRVDIVPHAIAMGGYDDVAPRAVRLALDGQEFLVAPLALVIASKEALGRPKDLAALPALRATLDALDADE